MRRALEGLDGLKKAVVSFNEKQAVVYFEEGKVTVQEMIEAVNRTGFRATELEMKLRSRSSTDKAAGIVR